VLLATKCSTKPKYSTLISALSNKYTELCTCEAGGSAGRALIAALQTGRIAGAVLDVYAGQLAGRPPRRELVEFPQVALTPHIAGRGDPSGDEPVKRLFAENLRRYLEGQPLLNLVDRSRGY
jgi:phosphoglycerate dehydrogenase-like enzyme